MFAYALQDSIQTKHKRVQVYVCHPGASHTSLIRDTANFATRFAYRLMVKIGITQSAEKGAYSQVMCATENNLKQRAYYGPTGWLNFGGPVGECNLADFVLDQAVQHKLWTLSEQETSLSWSW